MQDSSESRTPKSVEMDEALTSPAFEFKLPDGPDMRKYRGRIGCEDVVDDCALMDSEDKTDEPKIGAYPPRKNDNFRQKYQNSIFSSTLSTMHYFCEIAAFSFRYNIWNSVR